MNPATASLIERAMAKREAEGLHVRWVVPADAIQPEHEWSAYASSPEVRRAWIREKAALGWRLLSLSADAAALLRWCEGHSSPCSYSTHHVVNWNWHSVSAALGLGEWHVDSHWPRIHVALDELHAAGRLAYHDHGPGTFGHTTTLLIEAPVSQNGEA